MMGVVFCLNCDEKREYTVRESKEEVSVKGLRFPYIRKTAYCAVCGEEVYVPEVNDENVQAREDSFRRAARLITVDGVKKLLDRYSIGAGPLAALLGWGEITINRYVGGQLPSKENSEILMELLSDPRRMDKLLEAGKDRIKPLAYGKCRSRLDELLPVYGDEKIELVTRYFLSRSGDITQLALQKLLYYAQGFFPAFFGRELFPNPCQAWVYGPVYPAVYHQYKPYGADPLEMPTADLGYDLQGLSEEEMHFLDCIIDSFGKYSGGFLSRISHKEFPWIEARGNLSEDDKCINEISKENMYRYFSDEVKRLDIRSPEELERYIDEMKKKI